MDEILGGPDRGALPRSAKSHNDLVRGWRNYYYGNSSEMDLQLAELDNWRMARCRTHLADCEQDPDGAAVWFERLVDEVNDTMPPGVYSHHEETGSRSLELPPTNFDHWRDGAGQSDVESRGDRTFSGTSQLHNAAIGRKQLPSLDEDGWLRVPTFGSFITRSRALVVVRRKKLQVPG